MDYLDGVLGLMSPTMKFVLAALLLAGLAAAVRFILPRRYEAEMRVFADGATHHRTGLAAHAGAGLDRDVELAHTPAVLERGYWKLLRRISQTEQVNTVPDFVNDDSVLSRLRQRLRDRSYRGIESLAYNVGLSRLATGMTVTPDHDLGALRIRFQSASAREARLASGALTEAFLELRQEHETTGRLHPYFGHLLAEVQAGRELLASISGSDDQSGAGGGPDTGAPDDSTISERADDLAQTILRVQAGLDRHRVDPGAEEDEERIFHPAMLEGRAKLAALRAERDRLVRDFDDGTSAALADNALEEAEREFSAAEAEHLKIQRARVECLRREMRVLEFLGPKGSWRDPGRARAERLRALVADATRRYVELEELLNESRTKARLAVVASGAGTDARITGPVVRTVAQPMGGVASVLAALLGGAAIAAVWKSAHRRRVIQPKTQSDIESILEIPVLAVIPEED